VKFFEWLGQYRLWLIAAATGAAMVFVVLNPGLSDMKKSRTVSQKDLEAGYWEGFQDFRTSIGTAGKLMDEWNKYVIPNGKSGFLVFGPYVTLPAGAYEVWFYYEAQAGNPPEARLTFDVVADRGAAPLAKSQVMIQEQAPGESIEVLKFTIPEERQHVEWRVDVTEGVLVTLKKIVAYKQGEDA
jgi:hypothetical protein